MQDRQHEAVEWGGSGESKRTWGEDIIKIYSIKDERFF